MPSDRQILRELAERKLQIANDPVNLERRRLWLAHHGLEGERPMVLAESGGVRDTRKPFEPELRCDDEWARGVESGLLGEIWRFEKLKDDHVIEPFINVGWAVRTSDYGVEVVQHHGENEGRMGALRWDPPIADLDSDFDKLRPRTYSVDREATQASKCKLEDVLGDILPVRIRGSFWWTLGLTIDAIQFIGLEQLMLAMYDNPDGLRRVMSFLCEEHLAYAKWLESEQLLTLNNENDYIGSGSAGYVPDLPGADWHPGDPVRLRNQWVLLESQETVGVGPELFETFIFPYQQKIARYFGLVYYGCCEPVHTRWDVLRKLENMRAVSIAPWADEAFMAEAMGSRYVYSRKPNPTLISTSHFDEAAIRADIRKTLEVTRRNGCNVEIAMKDVHTLNEQPDRLARWVELARDEIAKSV